MQTSLDARKRSFAQCAIFPEQRRVLRIVANAFLPHPKILDETSPLASMSQYRANPL